MSRRRGAALLIIAAIGLVALAGAAWLAISRLNPEGFAAPAAMTTLAGNGERGFADGAGGAARFSDPFGLAIDGKGVIYVADAGAANRIRRIEPDGRTSTLPGTFDTPSGVAVDGDGNVIVADTGANLIRRITPDGRVQTIAGDGTAGFRDGPAAQAQFNGPVGVAAGGEGEVYVADTYNDRIRLITRDGQVRTLAGAGAPGFADGAGAAAAFHTPSGLALAPDGTLLVADTGNNAMRRVDRDGAVTTLAQWAAEGPAFALREPVGVAVTAKGYVYVSAFRRSRILELSPAGDLRVLAGRNDDAPGDPLLWLARPAGLAVDRRGALYVAETARYAVRKLTPHPPRKGPPPAPAPLTAPTEPLLQASLVPWPLAPQDGWHEVVGTVGEVRRAGDGNRVHGGLDVSADVGAPVLAMADEKVVGPIAASGAGTPGESLQVDHLTYVHMRVGRTAAGEPLDPARFQLLRDPEGRLLSVRVKRGTRFRAGETLGTINQLAHVHLELGPRGGDANAVGLRLPGFVDTVAPKIREAQLLDSQGRRLVEQAAGRLVVERGAGPISIVADAWDQVDGNEPRRRLGLYRAGYQILDAAGSPAPGFEQPLINIEFDRLPADREQGAIAYAPGSDITVYGAAETRFFYLVTNRVRGGRAETGHWDPAALPAGDYIVRVYAADFAGNVAQEGRDLPVTVR